MYPFYKVCLMGDQQTQQLPKPDLNLGREWLLNLCTHQLVFPMR
jgi:hypothetical protein